MGTPKQLNRFSVREMYDALSFAKETAMDFRSLDARVKALDYLRTSLLPMVEWFDKPLKECFPPWSIDASTKRAFPLFGQFGKLCPVALTRKGDWVTLTFDEVPAKVKSVSPEWLVSAISRSRHNILEAAPWGHNGKSLVTAESAGMKAIIEHCAFLKYLTLGMKEFDKTLKERECRLRTMRYNYSFLKSFVGGIDPLEYDAPKSSFTGYALFERHSGGTGRCSGTYLVPGPVEEEMVKRNKKRDPGSTYEYYVYEEHHRFVKLKDFLSRVVYSINEVSEGGVFARKPLSDDEMKVITDYIKEIGNFAT